MRFRFMPSMLLALLLPSASPLVAVQSTMTATALTLTTSSTYAGQPATLTAKLTPSSVGALTTNGEAISFFANGSSFGTATLSSGIATLHLASPPVGIYTLTASYAGDSNFQPSTSSSSTVTLDPPPTLPARLSTTAKALLQANYR